MRKTFRPYNLNQPLLLPPDLQDWVPEGHLARFVSDVVDSLDLTGVYAIYERKDGRGAPAYNPTMMTKLLVYGYCTGVCSSRRIERGTFDDVPFRFLSADQHPDHDSISEFRKRCLAPLSALFLEVLQLCRKAGLVKLGHVALDGTKMKANASKHKAMSYDRMSPAEQQLVDEVHKLLADAERVDREEDEQYGKGKRGDELPPELARREDRLVKIRAAKAALEQEAREKAEREAQQAREKNEERRQREQETGKKAGGHPHREPDPSKAVPEPKAQRNFTDPDARIMRDGATKSFLYAYNAQIAVDSHAQVIVAASITQQAVDSRQLIPVLEAVLRNMGRLPEATTADAGYFSEANVTSPALAGTELYIPPNQKETSGAITGGMGRPGMQAAVDMRAKLSSDLGKAIYRLRKAIVEPVFGQIKDARGIRHFLLRGLEKVEAEWQLICMTHNLLKLFRAGKQGPACPA